MIDEYRNCLDLNYSEVLWLKNINSGINNPLELVLHPMKSGFIPQCRGDCPYSKKCKELWER